MEKFISNLLYNNNFNYIDYNNIFILIISVNNFNINNISYKNHYDIVYIYIINNLNIKPYIIDFFTQKTSTLFIISKYIQTNIISGGYIEDDEDNTYKYHLLDELDISDSNNYQPKISVKNDIISNDLYTFFNKMKTINLYEYKKFDNDKYNIKCIGISKELYPLLNNDEIFKLIIINNKNNINNDDITNINIIMNKHDYVKILTQLSINIFYPLNQDTINNNPSTFNKCIIYKIILNLLKISKT